MATSHGCPASTRVMTSADPRQLRRPAHENVERRLPVLHAPTSLRPGAWAARHPGQIRA